MGVKTLSLGFDISPAGGTLFLQDIDTGGAERVTFSVKFVLVFPTGWVGLRG